MEPFLEWSVQAETLVSHHSCRLCKPEATSHSYASSRDPFKVCGSAIKRIYKKGNQHAEKIPPLKHSLESRFSKLPSSGNLGALFPLLSKKSIWVKNLLPFLIFTNRKKKKKSNKFPLCIELRMIKSHRWVKISMTIQSCTKITSKIRQKVKEQKNLIILY